MAKKAVAKRINVKVKRPFMLAGKIVPAKTTEKKGKVDVEVDVVITLTESFARELIANGKAELDLGKPNYEAPKKEQSLEDELEELS
jgi:hypothetical protein